MFGAPDKDKIKHAFQTFEDGITGQPVSQDPIVRLIVNFILSLKEAFNHS